MPFEKGHKLATGRPRGSLSKRNQMLEEIASRHKTDPFDILMKMAAGDWKGLGYDSEVYVMEGPSGATKIGYTISPEMRLSAAKECCQYLYAKKKEDDPIEVPQLENLNDEEKRLFLAQAKDEIKKLEAEIGSEDGIESAVLWESDV